MKKLSKILAALLSVCVIAGLIAVFASAEDAADFREVSENFDTLTDAGTNAPLDTWTTDSTGAVVGDLAAAQVTVGSAQSPVNKYVKLYATAGKGESMPVSGGSYRNGTNFVSYKINGAGVEQKINNHRYTVLQFLFTADGGKYVDGAYIQPITTGKNDLGSVKITLKNGKYYAEAGTNTVAASSVELNTDGEWNVVTYVIAMDSFADGSATIGDKSKTNSYIYVNGKYCAKRWLSSAYDYGYFTSLKIGRYYSTSVAAGDNIIVDGVNVRTYLNNLGANGETTYTTAAGVYGVSTFLSDSPTVVEKADAFKMQDVKYSNYSTTADYPKLSENYVLPGVVAYIGDLGYLNIDMALAAVKDGETIRIGISTVLSGISEDTINFTVETMDGAELTIPEELDEVFYYSSEEIDGGVRYVFERIAKAAIGETKYYDLAKALAAIKEGETIELWTSAELSGISEDTINFTVEAIDGAELTIPEELDEVFYCSSEEIDGGVRYVFERIAKATIGAKKYYDLEKAFKALKRGETIKISFNVTIEEAFVPANILEFYMETTNGAELTFSNGFKEDFALYPEEIEGEMRYGAERILKATIGETKYYEADEALAALKDGETIKFYVDFEIKEINMDTLSSFKVEAHNGANVTFAQTIKEKYAIGKETAVGFTRYEAVKAVIASIGATKYYDANEALAALKNGTTIKFYVDFEIKEINTDTISSFKVEAYNGASVTFAQGVKEKYTIEKETAAGFVSYAVVKTVIASVGETKYYDADEALAALKDGGTIKFYVDATITGVSFPRFNVEVYNNAKLTIDLSIQKLYNVSENTIDKVTYYEFARKAVASVGGRDYYDIAEALAALTEGGTIKIFANATLTGVGLKKFYVEAYDGAVPTIKGYETETEAIEGGVRYTATVMIATPPSVDGVEYDDVASALAAIKNGSVVKFYTAATITGVTLDSFTVEAYNGVDVVFAVDVLLNHDVVKRVGQSATYYTVTARPYITEYRDNFDGTFSSGTTVEVTENGKVINKYLKLTSGATLNLLSGVSNVTTFDKNAYAVTQYLFSAENGEYMTGTIKLTDAAGSNCGVLAISKSGDKYYVTVTGDDLNKGATTYALNSNGDWNVVTIIQTKYAAHKTYAPGAAQGQISSIYVNGTLVGYKSQSGILQRGALTKLTVTKSGGGNLIFDGFNARFYRSGLGTSGEPIYSTGANNYMSSYVAKGEYRNLVDIYYNNYSTTADYPATLVNGAVHTQSGAVAYIGDVGYFDATDLLDYVQDGDNVTLNVDLTVDSLPEGIKRLTFDGTGVVTFSDDILEKYTYRDGILTKNVSYTVNWLLSEGAEPFKTENLIFTGLDSEHPNAELLSALETNNILGNYKTALAWQYRIGEGEYLPLSGFEICDDGDVVTIIPSVSTVIWYHADGTLKLTEYWFVGSEIEKQENDVYGGGYQHNGWYEVVYGWNSTDFTAKPGTVEYRQVYAPVSAVDIKFNFTLDGGLAPTYYLNAPLANVKIKSILASTNLQGGMVYDYLSSFEMVEIGGKEYYMYNLGRVSLADWSAIYSFQVIYEIEVEGITYTLESKVAKTTIASEENGATAYAKVVLAGGAAGACSKDSEFIASLIDLIKSTYALENDDTIDEIIDAYVDAHKAANEGCTCFDGDVTASLPTSHNSKVSYAAITNLGIDLVYVITNDGATLSVRVPKTLGTRQEISVSASLVGIGVDPIKNLKKTGEQISVKFKYSGTDGDFLVYTANSAAIKAYNAANVQTITISRNEKTLAQGTFSLGEYIYRMNEAFDFYEWSGVDADNDGNVDGFIENENSIGAVADRKAFDALLAYLNFSKESEKYVLNK